MILMSCISTFYYIRIVQFLFFNVTEKPKFYYTPSYTISLIMILITFLNVFFCCAPWLLMDILYFETLMFFIDNFIETNTDLLNQANNLIVDLNLDIMDSKELTSDNESSVLFSIDSLKDINIISIKELDWSNVNFKELLTMGNNIMSFINCDYNNQFKQLISFEEYVSWFNSLDSETVKLIFKEYSFFDKTYIYKGDAIDWYEFNLELKKQDSLIDLFKENSFSNFKEFKAFDEFLEKNIPDTNMSIRPKFDLLYK